MRRATRGAWLAVAVAVFVLVVVLVVRSGSTGGSTAAPATTAAPLSSAAPVSTAALGTAAPLSSASTTATPVSTGSLTTVAVTVVAGTVPAPPPGLAVPDPRLTPGAVLAGVTTVQVCTAGFAAAVRDVSESVKDTVFAEYGITVHSGATYEVDHLVSLELGGSNDIANLWPEPQPGAGDKDQIENLLHREVCDGAITLAEAQAAIRHWWTVAPVAASPAGTAASSPPGTGAEGPIARCKDGSYSYASQHQGACSHHGGVAEFYR